MKRSYFIFFLATLLISCEKPISDFQSKNFIKFFGSGFESKGNDVIELSDGGYVFTGYDKINVSDQQIFAGKVDKNGNLIWSNTYGKNNAKAEGKIVKATSDGFLIAGTSIPTSSSITRSFIMKVNTYGDSLWYKEIDDSTYSIVVNDILVTSSNIYVAGQSYKSNASKSDYYRAKLNTSGELLYGKSSFLASNSSYKRIFQQQDNNLLLVGTFGESNLISIVPIDQNTMNETSPTNTVTPGETAADATLNGDKLYLLINKNQTSLKLSKLNSGYIEEWQTETINSITGKSVVYNVDGTLMIGGESVDDLGNSLINFIKINSDGSVYNGQTYRTFLGTIGRLIQTSDNGLIMVGTTNETYGKNVQLIKTDKDYFMLKK
jgi:hypothetical protein